MAFLLLGPLALGCYGNRIIGSKHDAFIPALEFRGQLIRRPRFGMNIFVTAAGFQGKVDATMEMTDPVYLDFPVRGRLEEGFGRLGIEFIWFDEPDGQYAFGLSCGLAGYGYLIYDYVQGETPAREEGGGWLAPLANPGVFIRSKIAPRALLRAEAHFGLGSESFGVEEAAVLIEYDLGAKVRVSAGWRRLYLETDNGSTEMKFNLSGPCVGVVIVL